MIMWSPSHANNSVSGCCATKGETYDVDEIELSFFNLSDELVGSVALQPRLGENANGQNANNIIAEVINLPNVYTASRVNALLKSDNGQIDFQNFVFRAA